MRKQARERELLAVPQVYRGFAALLVVLFHSAGTIQAYFGDNPILRPFGFGFAGVYFFFVLSGFIIYYIHRVDIDAPRRMLPYVQKRLIRIYPLYIAVTLALLPFWLFLPGSGEQYLRDPIALLLSLLLIPQQHPPNLSVAWTLIHEMMFYTLFAALILSRLAGYIVLGAWFDAVVAANILSHGDLSFPYSVLLSINNLLFAFGLVAAYLVERYDRRPPFGGLMFALGNLAFLAAGAWVVYLEPPGPVGRVLITLVFGMASFAVLLQSANPLLDSRLRRVRLWMLLGDASYSIYLVHYPVVSLICKLLQRSGSQPPEWLLFAVAVFVAVACGVGVHLLVERSLLSWFRTRFRGPLSESSHGPQKAPV